jgi:hypothetical protein
MSKTTEVQSAVTPEVRLVIESEDAAGNPLSKTWRLVLDYRALALIETATGRDLKDYKAWAEIKSSEFPVFVHACLHRYHKEVALEEVENGLNPACQTGLSNAFYELCFPGALERWAKIQAEAKEKTGATASPNVETATA